MPHILSRFQGLVEREDAVTGESPVTGNSGSANGGNVVGGNQSGTGSKTKTNTGGNGGVTGDVGSANGGNVVGGNQSGAGSNTETNTGGNGGTVTGNGGSANGGSVVGGNQSGGGTNSETNTGGNAGSIDGSVNGGSVTGETPPATVGNTNSGSLVPNATGSRIITTASPSPIPPSVSIFPTSSSITPTSSLPLSSPSTKLVSNSITELSTPKPSPSPTSILHNSTSHNNNRGAVVGGIVGGLISLLILIACLVYYFIRRRFRRGKKDSLNCITAFDASQYQNIGPMSFSPEIKLCPSSALPPDSPLISSRPPSTRGSSDSLISVNGEAQRNTTVDESAFHNGSPLRRDSMRDQITSLPNPPLQQELPRSISILSDNPTNFTPIFREIFHQGRNQDSADGVPRSSIQVFFINEPSNVDGLRTAGDNRESSGGLYLRPYSSRNINNLLPPSYDSE